MGIWDAFIGNTGADAARSASADTYDKQLAAAEASRRAGGNYESTLQQLSQLFSPYVQGGQRAQSQVYDLLGLNGADAQTRGYGQFRADPGYEYQRSEGLRAVDQSAAARGMSNSGATLKALQDRGQGLADQSYGNYLQRLMSLGGQGLTATGSQVNTASQGALGNLNANLQAGQQQYGAAGTTGQGEIAAANAQTQGAQNLANVGMSGLGYLTGNFGSSFNRGGNPWARGSSWGAV